jgi:hypothetical protein
MTGVDSRWHRIWLLGGLGSLVALHAWGAFHSPTRLWAFDSMRYLEPWVAWSTWIVALLLLVPSIARRAMAIIEAPSRHAGLWVAALVGAATWTLSDQTWFIGDFLIRQASVENGSFSGNFEQALPGEILVHYVIPRLLATVLGSGVALYPRVIGALEAIVLAALGLRLARSLGFRGGAAVAATGLICGGGYLLMFTGLSRAGREMCLVVLAGAFAASRVVARGRGMIALSWLVLLGCFMHRCGPFLLPLWIVAFRSWRAAAKPGRRISTHREVAGLAAFLAVAGVLGWMAVDRWLLYDWARHVDPTGTGSGGILHQWGASQHWIDLFDILVVLGPASLVAAPFVFPSLRRGEAGSRSGIAVALAAPWVVAMLVARPQQGLIRDWDVFSAGGVALAVVVLFGFARTIRADSRSAWMLVATAGITSLFTLQWMIHFHDPPRALARVNAYGATATFLPADTRARMLDFVGLRSMRLELWDRAAGAYRQAATLAPHRRVMISWGISETLRGSYADADSVFRVVLDANPRDPVAWVGRLGAARYVGDSVTIHEATRVIAGFEPGGAYRREIAMTLETFPGLLPRAPGDTLRNR